MSERSYHGATSRSLLKLVVNKYFNYLFRILLHLDIIVGFSSTLAKPPTLITVFLPSLITLYIDVGTWCVCVCGGGGGGGGGGARGTQLAILHLLNV